MIICQFESGQRHPLRHLVVHLLVENQNKLLLVKRAQNLPEGGKWALPGGFLDRDETLYQGGLRELREETGWDGEILRLFRINSNPGRPREDRQNVAVELIVKPLKQVTQPDAESTKIEWIEFEKLFTPDQFAFDLGTTIELYKKYRISPFKLPVVV